MKRFTLFTSILFFVFFFVQVSDSAVMEDYCQVPPYVTQNIPPNVMVVMDNSGSMFNFAYVDTATNNFCTNSASPCTSFDPNKEYYGYFDNNYWYTDSNQGFKLASLKSSQPVKGNREWDPNFLNWLTMRRVDVIRKVMTGGLAVSTGGQTSNLRAEKPDGSGRGIYKQIASIENYVDDTDHSGTRCIRFDTGNNNPASFDILNSAACSSSGDVDTSYDVDVEVNNPVEGILQDAVGTKARMGLTFYNYDEGGYVSVDIDGQSLSSTVNDINLTKPDGATPLAETLWTVYGYYAQESSLLGGPGPRYNNGDYSTNNNDDPWNYGTGGSPRRPSCAQSFVLYLTDGEPCRDGNLPGTVEDYATGRSDYDCTIGNCPAAGPFAASTIPGSCTGSVAGFEDVALYMHTTDHRSDMAGRQNLTLFTVFAFGRGSNLLKYASINGGFEDLNGNNVPDQQSEWDQSGDGEPDNYYEADDGEKIEAAIRDAFSNILKRASSGTAASVMASGEGSGANLIQAVFYPNRRFGNDIISWSGVMQNLWYYVDPKFHNSSVRENTTSDTPNPILNLFNDRIVNLYFDLDNQKTMANLFNDSDGDGDADGSKIGPVPFEEINYIWEAGNKLWRREAEDRKIFTSINGLNLLDPSSTKGGFYHDNTHATALMTYLNVTDDNSSGSALDEAENVIRYSRGEDFPALGFRSRSVTMNIDATTLDTRPWKLGDIVNSTPKISSWFPLNRYHKVYRDYSYGPYGDPYQSDSVDDSHYITTQAYKDRGMVYVGGNDGMLHAFKLGTLELKWGQDSATTKQVARLTGNINDLGKEMWSYIPKNVLPYLKYQTDPSYCHLYTVDLTPVIFDASIDGAATADKDVNSWRTVLIGGMRRGGACRETSSSCSDCVKTPIDDVGYSSYFALDITNEAAPSLLWEFPNDNTAPAIKEQLGFATTSSSIIRIGDKYKNGDWYVVFASGPTGYIDTTGKQFMGRSDQNLRLFVLDLRTGTVERVIDTNIQRAFAGTIKDTTNDTDEDYQDDAMYVGYVKKQNSSGLWDNGGIGRLKTNGGAPLSWEWSVLMDNIGPITSGATRMMHRNRYSMNKTLWLYFGTGRYYFDLENEKDDETGQRSIFGIKEPCMNVDGSWKASCPSVGSLTDVTNVNNAPTQYDAELPAFNGWTIDLDPDGPYTYPEGDPAVNVTQDYHAERVVTAPLASTNGCVFFTTFKPYNESCTISGKSFLWVVDYSTGGLPDCSGNLTFQVSTGSIEQVEIPEDKSSPDSPLTDGGGRKTSAIEGEPSSESSPFQVSPPPFDRTLHRRER